jgi:pimeloyl-ACP methyl ester carboxylesterase
MFKERRNEMKPAAPVNADTGSAGVFVDTHTSEHARHRLVFVHGAMDRSTSFSKVRARLREETTVAYDRRGYARSVDLGPAVEFHDHVRDLISVIDGQPAVLVGHSYGGNVCLAVAAHYPGLVTALVVYEAPMSWERWWPSNAGGSTIAVGLEHGPAAAAESFMRRIVGDAIWERLGDKTREERRAEGESLLFDLAGLRGKGCPYDVSRIACPTVIGYGESSLPHQIRSSTELHQRLLRSNPTAVVLRGLHGVGHGAHNAAPGAFVDLVNEALALADSSDSENASRTILRTIRLNDSSE